MPIPNKADLENMKQDIDDLEQIVNSVESTDVTTRLGKVHKSLTGRMNDLQAKLDAKEAEGQAALAAAISRLNRYAAINYTGSHRVGHPYQAGDVWQSTNGSQWISTRDYISVSVDQDISDGNAAPYQSVDTVQLFRELTGMSANEIGRAISLGRHKNSIPREMVADLNNKIGVIISNTAEMGDNYGPFSPEIINADDVRSISPDFPGRYKYLAYFSTDHSSGVGGIYLYLCEGDLLSPYSWVSYTDAVEDGYFDYLTTKPAGNPIYIDDVYGDQTETPCVNLVNGQIFMSYQNRFAAEYEGTGAQQTCLAKSPDAINFTRSFVAANAAKNGVMLTYDPRYAVGDGHTGYFAWAENPIKSIPEKYLGYSLHGGSVWPYAAQWVSDDAENWRRRAILSWPKGSSTAHIGDGDYIIRAMIHPKNIRATDGGYRVIGHANRYLTSGTDFKYSIPVEFIINDDGTKIISKAVPVMDLGDVGDVDEAGAGIPMLISDGGRDYVVYYVTDASQENRIAISEMVYKNGYIRDVSSSNSTVLTDLKMTTTLPAELSGVDSVGYSYEGSVIAISAGETITLSSETFAVDKATRFEFDFEFKQLGLTDLSHALELDFGGGNILRAETDTSAGNPYMKLTHIIGGAVVSEKVVVEQIGYGDSYSDRDESVQAFRRFGIVYNGADQRAYLTSYGVQRQRFEQSFMLPISSNVVAKLISQNLGAEEESIIVKAFRRSVDNSVSDVDDFDDIDSESRYFYYQDGDSLEIIEPVFDTAPANSAKVSFKFNVSDSLNKDIFSSAGGGYIRIKDNGGLRITDGTTFINHLSGLNDGSTHHVVFDVNFSTGTTITVDGVAASYSALSGFAVERIFAALNGSNKAEGWYFDIEIEYDGTQVYQSNIDGAGEPDQYGKAIVTGFKRRSANIFKNINGAWVNEDGVTL